MFIKSLIWLHSHPLLKISNNPNESKCFHSALPLITYDNLYWIHFCNKEFLPFGYFRMTKCTFHKYGTSGNIENHDVLCILPLNIGNIHPMKILSHIFFSQWKNLYLHLVLVSGAWFTLLPCHPLQVQRYS